MKERAAIILACAVSLALFACAEVPDPNLPDAKIVQQFEPKNLNTHTVRSIRQVVINRIAVMPIVAAVPFGGEPLAAGAADVITADIYRQVSGTWKLVPQNSVMRAVQQVPPNTSLDDTALKVGETVGADGVLYGMVERYVERIGVEYSAEQPASVAFTVKLLDMKSRQAVWTAKFSQTQQPLANNFFNLPNFLQNKGQWVRAADIANEGVNQAIANLRESLSVAPNAASQAMTPPPIVN